MARPNVFMAMSVAVVTLLSIVARADPDPNIQAAAGLDTGVRQVAAGATNSPGGGDPLPDGIAVTPPYGADWASSDDVHAAVGDVTLSMDRCPDRTLGEDSRIVRVQLSKPDFEAASILNALLIGAAKFAWENCPQPFLQLGSGQPTGQFHYDVSEIDIYLPDGTKGFTGSLGMYGQGDQALTPGNRYVWQHLTNLKSIHDRQAAEQAQQAAQAQAQADSQAQQAAQDEARRQASDRWWRGFWNWVLVGMLALFVLWLWTMREAILTWYFALKPHPAAEIVRRRIDGGAPLDGALFAEIMRPVPGSPVEQRVRADQARELAAMARAAAENRVRELEKLRTKAIKEAAFIRAQEDLRSAVEAHELAMARLDALREWRGRNVG